MKKKSQLDTYLKRIEASLTAKGLSKAKAARVFGVDNSTFHRWLKDEKSAENLAKQLEDSNYANTLRSGKLSAFAVEDLVDELARRGWEVNLTRKSE